MVLTSSTVSAAEQLEIKVAIDAEYAPYEFVDSDGKIKGFLPDLLREIEATAGIRFTFIPMSWPDAVKGLESGEVDLINMIRTPDRVSKYEFSEPHSGIDQSLFRNRYKAGIEGLDSISGAIVILQQHDIALEKLSDRNDFERLIVKNKQDGFIKLNSGKAAAFFSATQPGLYFIKQHNLTNVELAEVNIWPQDFCFTAIKGNSAMISLLDSELVKLRASGRYDELFNQWMIKPDSWFVKYGPSVLMLALALFVLFAVVFIWSVTLRRAVDERTAELHDSENVIRTLYQLSIESHYNLEEKVHKLLELGCNRFHLEIGIMSQIVKDDYEVVYRHCPAEIALNEGDHFELGNTYCAITMKANGPVGFEHVKESEIRIHPAYKAFGLEAYIGTPIIVQGQVFGTLNFSSPAPMKRKFEDVDIDALQLMASWIGNELSRTQREMEMRKLSQAVEQAGESVMITNKEGTIEYVNSSFTKITGYLPEEVLGKNPRILKSGNQSKEFYKSLWRTISRGEVWHSAVVDRRKDGSQYPALMTISPIFNEDEQITHYVGIQQDMTMHESLEEKFRQAQKMEALGTLVGGIAHDFNNMLAGMTGNLYLAKKKVAGFPDVVEKLDSVSALSFRAAEMIKQLLTFARKGVVEMKPFGLTSFIKEASKLNTSSIPENIHTQSEFCAEELIVRGDATQLQQVLMNLLNNARDAVENVSDPVIMMKLEEFEGDQEFMDKHPDMSGSLFAHLIVSDNGSGISSADKEHIFEPFYTTKGIGVGTGLGLSMAYGAVQSHDGILEMESTQGVGTTFHIYLPLLEEHKIELIADGSVNALPGHGELILVVDDNAEIRKTSREVLENLGYKVLVAIDGLEAIDTFTQHQDDIALIIMDVVMPRVGGLKAFERIKIVSPEAKVIFATGYDKDETLKGEMPADKTLILSKPYNIVKLSQMIREQLDA